MPAVCAREGPRGRPYAAPRVAGVAEYSAVYHPGTARPGDPTPPFESLSYTIYEYGIGALRTAPMAKEADGTNYE